MIRSEFIQSKRYPSNLMQLASSEICDCDCSCISNICTINASHTVPNNGCLLPINRSPLQEGIKKVSKLELCEEMFKFAWKKVLPTTLKILTMKKIIVKRVMTGGQTFELQSCKHSSTYICYH